VPFVWPRENGSHRPCPVQHDDPVSAIEVRRSDDGELLGFVELGPDGRWRALTVFGAELGLAETQYAAVDVVESGGLAVLAERWWHHDGERWLPAVIKEAAPKRVSAWVGEYPDTPWSLTLVGADAAALRRHPG
jgi:hypothetical protein